MAAQWQVEIKRRQRKEVDKQLLIQAVIALGRQFSDEERKARTEMQAVETNTQEGTE
jgi:hypothetical protein